MGLDHINSDGGHLPPGAAASTPSNLLKGYSSKPAAERSAFRQCICPRHHIVETASDVVTLTDAMPGDTASVAESSAYLYLFKTGVPTTNTNWVNMLDNTTAPAPS